MKTCIELGELPLKKLTGNKSAMIRRGIDAFMAEPEPRWLGTWIGTGRTMIGVSLEPEAYKRLKEKAKKWGYSANQCVEIGIMALEE